MVHLTITNVIYNSIVHGFLNATYSVMEGDIVDILFDINVKGEAAFGGLFVVTGIITAEEGGTASKLLI